MSTGSGSLPRKNKVYPPPDRSKCYDEVPRVQAPYRHPLLRWLGRFGHEIAFKSLDPWEKVGLLSTVAFILVLLLVGLSKLAFLLFGLV